MTIFLALPAYNEAAALPLLLEDFRTAMHAHPAQVQVIVVDDGSTDATCAVLKQWATQLPLEIIRHSANQGLGPTIQDALRAACARALPGDIIVTMDADYTHSPALIPGMIDRIGSGDDIVIASRYRPGSKVTGLSFERRLMTLGARFLYQTLFPIAGVRDYTCGFRAYRASVLQSAFARSGGTLVEERSFACMAEILLKLRGHGLRMSEVPMVLRYERKPGPSKMNVGATVRKTLAMIFRSAFKR